jgi:hypothetical protein
MPFAQPMLASIYADSIAAFLLLSALCHLFLERQVNYWLRKPGVVRFIGACLLLFSLPCLCWRGWYFWTLSAALAISGAWRCFFPQHSIRAQERAYPRWVHGCLLLAAAIAVRALRP